MFDENKFKDRLNQAMKEQNLKQVDLIRRTKDVMKEYIKDYNGDGIDKGLLNKYIKGTSVAKQNNIFILAKALNVSEVWLMGFDAPKEPESIETIDKNDFVSSVRELLNSTNDLTEKDKFMVEQTLKLIERNK